MSTDAVGFVDEFLEHYGIPGMKWGRRKQKYSSTPSASAIASRKVQTTEVVGQQITAIGGKNRPAHDDAIRAAQLKQIAKASTVNALSNKELQDLNQRLNLEQQYSKLTGGSSDSVSKGQSFIASRPEWFSKRMSNITNSIVDELGKAHVKEVAKKQGFFPK